MDSQRYIDTLSTVTKRSICSLVLTAAIEVNDMSKEDKEVLKKKIAYDEENVINFALVGMLMMNVAQDIRNSMKKGDQGYRIIED